MRETQIIEQIRNLARAGHRDPAVIRGIGDDCAIVRPAAKEDLVFTSDFVCEGRHFLHETHSAADVGHQALARSLSDLAAMGSEPVFCLVSLAVPAGYASKWIKGFYRGLLGLAKHYKISLAGGDTARFERVVADVMCCGRVARGRAILRSGAKPGDRIYVTGELGGSALGLATKRGKAWRRHLRPQPRIDVGKLLPSLGVSAAMDLSDGLSADLEKLCVESNVSARITSPLPVARGASVEQALHGGEDYELLFTAPARKPLPTNLEGLPISLIGVMEAAKRSRVYFEDRPLIAKGFDHFQ